jgi:DNA (cytosine-5)-methyltransferase 1
VNALSFGSVCSGIEAASVAWHPLGWRAAWLSEIEPFPCKVLAHHYPTVANLGDMTTIAAKVLAGEVEAPDVLVGGTPCQAFSVAGLRGGLADARGNLTLSFVELANAVDARRAVLGLPPAFILWENVPGVLSMRDNAFGALLGGMVGADDALVHGGKKPSWPRAGVVDGPTRRAAWRVLDAQYFGVAQRRKRVFLLARGGAGNWDAADALLPVLEGVLWHPAPRREAREDPAHGLRGRANSSHRDDAETFVTHSLTGNGFDASGDGTGRGTPLHALTAVSAAVTSKWAKGTGGPSGDECQNLILTGIDFQNCAATGDIIGTLMGEAASSCWAR